MVLITTKLKETLEHAAFIGEVPTAVSCLTLKYK